MNWQKIGVILSAVLMAGQAATYLMTGGYSVGGQISQVRSDIQLVNHKLDAAISLHEYRIRQLEVTNKLPTAN